MINFGLLLFGCVQIATGAAVFFERADIFGVPKFADDMDLHRYLMTALSFWVGIVYVVGSFQDSILPGAALLAVLNVVFETIFFWGSGLTKWYRVAGTILITALGVWGTQGISV